MTRRTASWAIDGILRKGETIMNGMGFRMNGEDPHLVKVMLVSGRRQEPIAVRSSRDVPPRLRFEGSGVPLERGVSSSSGELMVPEGFDLDAVVCRELSDNFQECFRLGYVVVRIDR